MRVLAAALIVFLLCAVAQAQTPTNWCDCMRFKKSTFETQAWTNARVGRCTRFAASTQQTCQAQGKAAVIDLDKTK
jgi:hypothetical protein